MTPSRVLCTVVIGFIMQLRAIWCCVRTPQWGAADAEIKVSSGENTELKRPPFKTWSRSVCSHTCYAYCQWFLPCLCLPFRSIHLHFFPKSLPVFPVLAVANTWFLCRPTDRVECPRNITKLKKTNKKNMTCGMMTCEMNNLEIEWSLCPPLM